MSLVNMRRRGRVRASVEQLAPIMSKLVVVRHGEQAEQLAEFLERYGSGIHRVRVWMSFSARWAETTSVRLVLRDATPEDVAWFALTDDGAREAART